MSESHSITQARLHELFTYCDGNLYWKKSPANGMVDGQIAGYVDKHGYRNINILGNTYKMHRLIWLMHYGSFPCKFIDHIDNDGSNSRIENLRQADKRQNALNRDKQSNNKSGYKGVSQQKNGKWGARAMINNKYKSLGVYKTKEEAALAYNEAAIKHFGEFARINKLPAY